MANNNNKNNILWVINFMFLSFIVSAQNVGIGVTNPSYSLDVSGSFRLRNTSNTAGIWFDGTSLPTRSFIGTYNEDHFGFYGGAGAGWNFLIHNNNNNVGIGVTSPLYRLDINGRMRIQNSTNSAGIWFDGISMPTRSFIGTQNQDNVGIYGNGGVGWNFVMNVTNGNIGIGTTSPTKKLDLNGTLRIRSNTPIKGSVLASKDANGNAEWLNPIAFRGEGLIDNVPYEIQNGVWTKVLFNQSPVYNYGNNYLPGTSIFLVPINGIYEFNTSVACWHFANRAQSIRFVLDRAGVISTLGEIYHKGISTGNNNGFSKENARLSSEYNLLAGDKVWVEIFVITDYGYPGELATSTYHTYFTGNLVSKI